MKVSKTHPISAPAAPPNPDSNQQVGEPSKFAGLLKNKVKPDEVKHARLDLGPDSDDPRKL